ncbi:hypothetical protein E4U30_006710 [Claviceps sp. LM220 group G6]|nr:hypothetical protein E4U30_006710 [Claviceps sp. LM220 group G6]
MDIPSSVDFGNSNNMSAEPEEYPLTFAEVIGIHQHRQEEIETIGNRHLDLRYDWRPAWWPSRRSGETREKSCFGGGGKCR